MKVFATTLIFFYRNGRIMNNQSHIRHYYEAFQFSQNFLNEMQITAFPVNVFELHKKIRKYYGLNVLVSTLSKYNGFQKSIDKKPTTIKDGRTTFDPNSNTYIIIYNEKRPEKRIRFTIAHEFGHVVLGHLSDKRTEIDRGGLADYEYYRYEGEANTFAGNLLVPPILIHEGLQGKKYSLQYIQSLFDVSKDCAEYRQIDYIAWKKMKPKTAERKLLARCAQQMHLRCYNNCDYQFYNKLAKYCPVCGHSRLSRIRSKDAMKYSCIPLDENSKARICPRCDNELVEYGDYCKICGLLLVNSCQNCEEDGYPICGELVDGDARYCPKCGSETSFGMARILKPWKVERGLEKGAEDEIESVDDDSDLPF